MTFRFLSKVALPTPSYTTSTPLPSVRRFTSASKSRWVKTITSSAPASRASRAFSSLEAVPITRAPPRRCVNQRRLTRFQLVRVVYQIVSGQAVDHRRRSLLIADRRWHGHKMLLGRHHELGVRAQHSAPRHTVTHFHRFGLCSHSGHDPRAFLAGDERQRRAEPAIAEVAINRVHPRN